MISLIDIVIDLSHYDNNVTVIDKSQMKDIQMTTISVVIENIDGLKNQPRELVEYIVTKYAGSVDKTELLKDFTDNRSVLFGSKANTKTTFQFYYRSLIKHNFIEVYENSKLVPFSDPKVDVLSTRPKSNKKTSELETRIADLEARLAELIK
jgi:hypothetical protein